MNNPNSVGVPMKRWHAGHLVFFVLIQGNVVALERFEKAIKDGDFAKARDALRAASIFMVASAAAMRFAGLYSRQAYDSEVVPTMSPPNVPEGFSGLLSRDHRALVRLITRLRPIFKSLPIELAHDHRFFLDCYQAAYASHKHVCSRFGGDERGSLLMGAQSKKTSVGTLAGLEAARLKASKGL
jgi:hypothetical protein